ncbi:MAG TPA: hypothetical protein VF135_07020 [Terriglobales bacterium]|jgi:hypothetical protein
MNMLVPRPLHDAFKSTCAARGEKMTDVLLQYISEYVQRYGLQPKKGRR